MLTKYEALDILDRMEFFQGQRAGRELWSQKNPQLQDIDIACFVRDISNLREYVSSLATDTNDGHKSADVVPRADVVREFAKFLIDKSHNGHIYIDEIVDLVIEYTEDSP